MIAHMPKASRSDSALEAAAIYLDVIFTLHVFAWG